MVATKTEKTIASTLTQQKVFDGIKQGFADAGFSSPIDDYTDNSSNKVVVYKVVIDSSKTYGSFYLKVRLTTSLGIGHQIMSGWNAINHSGTNGSTEVNYSTFSTSNSINVVTLNLGVESKLILLLQSTVFVPLGYFSPSNKPSWWDMNVYPYGFIANDVDLKTIKTCSLTPYSDNVHDLVLSGNNRLNGVNGQTNRRDVLQGVMLFSQTNTGISGKTSDDIVLCCANGTSRYDLLQVSGTTTQFIILVAGNGGVGMRVN